MKKKKIGIMGGSFDPIHYAHLLVAEEALSKFELEKIVFIPVGKAVHKESLLADKWHRYNMVKLAIETNSKFELSDFEIKKNIKTYTIDTIKNFNKNNEYEIYFITGLDSIYTIDMWKDYKELLSMCTFVAATRDGVDINDLNLKINSIKEKTSAKIFLFTIPKLEISSTDIRNRIREKRSIKYLLPESVENYIYKHALYKKSI